MSRARKGRVCIINVSKFERLPPLNGYSDDEIKLADMWFNIGFQVSRPTAATNRCLNAEVCTQTTLHKITIGRGSLATGWR